MYLNTKETAVLLGCTQRNIAYMVKAGKLKPINPNHKTGYLFIPKEVELFNSKKAKQNG